MRIVSWTTWLATAMVLILAADRGDKAEAAEPMLELPLQTRDPQTGEIKIEKIKVNPSEVGIVAVDMWNWHWCKTSTMRVGALVPRMNRCLEAARQMGMQVFLCPSDVTDNYVGTPQLESLTVVERIAVPKVKIIDSPPAVDGGGCTCAGKHRCQVNFGWDGMAPDLMIGPDDLMPNDAQMLYSVCQAKGLKHLIYMGVHTQACLLGKSIGLKYMTEAGMHCILARDLTDAHGHYVPEKGITPDDFTAEVVRHFEKHLSPTINMGDVLSAAGKWDDSWIVDPIRVAPWGIPARPHLFEDDEITVTLTSPWHPKAEIYYTTDGSKPTVASTRYTSPLKVSESFYLRAVGFEKGRQVCLESEGAFEKLIPLPPKPDAHLADTRPIRVVGPGHSGSSSSHRYMPNTNRPQYNMSNRKQPLRLRGVYYDRGLGVHAPNQMILQLKPEWDRFVALAGTDEMIVNQHLGSNLAKHPSVVFKVFIDGKLAASSPVMKVLEHPWRFNLKIPDKSRLISLVVTDAGDGNREDLANWVNAGFTLRKSAAEK